MTTKRMRRETINTCSNKVYEVVGCAATKSGLRGSRRKGVSTQCSVYTLNLFASLLSSQALKFASSQVRKLSSSQALKFASSRPREPTRFCVIIFYRYLPDIILGSQASPACQPLAVLCTPCRACTHPPPHTIESQQPHVHCALAIVWSVESSNQFRLCR